MCLSYQKHFCLQAALSQFFLSPIIPHDLWKTYLYLSLPHCFCKPCLVGIVYCSPVEIQYSLFCQRRALQTSRRGAWRKVAWMCAPRAGTFQCVFMVKWSCLLKHGYFVQFCLFTKGFCCASLRKLKYYYCIHYCVLTSPRRHGMTWTLRCWCCVRSHDEDVEINLHNLLLQKPRATRLQRPLQVSVVWVHKLPLIQFIFWVTPPGISFYT